MQENLKKTSEEIVKWGDRPYEPEPLRLSGESQEKREQNLKKLREAVALMFEDSATTPSAPAGHSEKNLKLAEDIRAGKKISENAYRGLVRMVMDDHSILPEDREIFKKNILE